MWTMSWPNEVRSIKHLHSLLFFLTSRIHPSFGLDGKFPVSSKCFHPQFTQSQLKNFSFLVMPIAFSLVFAAAEMAFFNTLISPKLKIVCVASVVTRLSSGRSFCVGLLRILYIAKSSKAFSLFATFGLDCLNKSIKLGFQRRLSQNIE